jgi:hypothetical protein
MSKVVQTWGKLGVVVRESNVLALFGNLQVQSERNIEKVFSQPSCPCGETFSLKRLYRKHMAVAHPTDTSVEQQSVSMSQFVLF